MAKLATVKFTGKSGKTYIFNVYEIGSDFNAIGAVYFITKRYKDGDSYYHDKIYVGETGDLSERFNDHHKQECFEKRKANCICVHREDDEDSRLKIEKDLVDAYDPPCNG